MYLELKFKKVKENIGKGWELYYVNEVEEKPGLPDLGRIRRVYLEDASYMLIPDEIDGLPVLSVASGFKVSPFTEVLVLPEFMTYVPADAFDDSRIESLQVGKRLIHLDFLSNLLWLKSVTISPGNETFEVYEGNIYRIGREELIWAKDSSIRPGTVTIARRAYTDLIMTNLFIPDSVVYIEVDAFINCDIDELSVSGEVGKIRESSFCSCRFKTLEFREGTSKGLSFSVQAISDCAIEKIILPERTNWVPNHTFIVTRLQEVEIAGYGYMQHSFSGEHEKLSRIAMKLRQGELFPIFGNYGLAEYIGQHTLPMIMIKENNHWTEELYW